MRHYVTSFIAFHWAAAFSLLAMVCALGGEHGVASTLNMFGLTLTGAETAALKQPLVTGTLSVLFGVVSVLFFWAFVATFFGETGSAGGGEDAVRIAFGSAAGVLSVMLIGGASQSIAGIFPMVAVQMAALLASYLAINAERWSSPFSDLPDDEDLRAAARVMALGAAHSSMLSRFSGRSQSPLGGN
jgi:hypothetical protein